jgi:TPR repeat protein
MLKKNITLILILNSILFADNINDFYLNKGKEEYNNKQYFKSLYWLNRSKNKESSYYISNIYFNNNDFDENFIFPKYEKLDKEKKKEILNKLIESATILNKPDSKYLLFKFYYYKDLEKSLYWLNKSVNQGYDKAIFKLGELYFNGNKYLKKDLNKSLQLFNLSYENYNNYKSLEYIAFINFYLAKNFNNDLHKNKKLKEALKYFNLSVKYTNSSKSKYMIGLFYYHGFYVTKNLNKTKKWLIEAKKDGYLPAINLLNNLKDLNIIN